MDRAEAVSEEAGTEILGETGQRLGDDVCNPKPGSQGRQLFDRTFRLQQKVGWRRQAPKVVRGLKVTLTTRSVKH